MAAATDNPILSATGSSRVRLRTLILWRWVAIAGQVAAISVAVRLFRLELDIGLCALAIGASAVANLIAMFVYPGSRRLSEGEMSFMLAFDICQLAALLYLTGGLHNPFALLILGPVTICATTLRPRAIVLNGGLAIALTTLLAFFYLPLVAAPGYTIHMPQNLVMGFWASITIGVVFIGVYTHSVASEIDTMSRALLATQMALGREQKLTDLAGVVAATAHELGTPLATIKLTSAELAEELADQPELREDAELITEQANRCRDILQSMGRAGKEDRHLATAPFSALVRDAAEPHLDRGKTVTIDDGPDRDEPEILRLPEVVHGLRNLIQNAVDFAESAVWIDLNWTGSQITFRIVDDGRGFPAHMIGRIGDPFVGTRRSAGERFQRPEYEGMGLGLFIAKTLLERTGAEISFANAREPHQGRAPAGQRGGAIVEAVWPRKMLEPEPAMSRRALGENPKIAH